MTATDVVSAHHAAAVATGVWRPALVRRNRLEERPQAAVAFEGYVPLPGADACSGRVYRDLLCRDGVGLSAESESAVMYVGYHNKTRFSLRSRRLCERSF